MRACMKIKGQSSDANPKPRLRWEINTIVVYLKALGKWSSVKTTCRFSRPHAPTHKVTQRSFPVGHSHDYTIDIEGRGRRINSVIEIAQNQCEL